MAVYTPEIECASRDYLHAVQSARLLKMVRTAYEKVPFYKRKFDEIGLQPGDIHSIDDITKLPFTVKTDLRDNYPFGLFAVPQGELVRIHASSGTTGKQTVVGYTAHDIDIWAEGAARALTAAGGTRNDIVHVSYGYGLFTGGLGLHYGAEHMGATALPVSSGNTKRQVQLLQDFGSDILCCTPSYAMFIGETVRDMGIDPKTLKLRAGLFGAEPWTDNMRREIERLLDIKAYDIYGLSEIAGPGVAYDCEMQDGLHINEDYFYPEVIDPDTLQPLPDGEYGELVFTCIGKAPGTLPHQGYLRPAPRSLRLRTDNGADVQAPGPQRRYADHPGRQRVPLSGGACPAGAGDGSQLSHPGGSEEQSGHYGGSGGDERRPLLGHGAGSGIGGAPHRGRAAKHAERARQGPPGGAGRTAPFRRQGQAGDRQPGAVSGLQIPEFEDILYP